MKFDLKAVLSGLGSGAVAGTLKGLDAMPDEQVKTTLVQAIRKLVEHPTLGKVRQRRLVGLLRDAAAEVFLKDLQ